jgi:membrane protein YdbS with pleckstrin-like domain
MNILGVSIDERFLTHRLKSTSVAGISCAIVALVLFMYRHYVDHIWSWDLAAVALTNVVVKISLMVWYRFND